MAGIVVVIPHEWDMVMSSYRAAIMQATRGSKVTFRLIRAKPVQAGDVDEVMVDVEEEAELTPGQREPDCGAAKQSTRNKTQGKKKKKGKKRSGKRRR